MMVKNIYIYSFETNVIFCANSLTGREIVKTIPKNDTEDIDVHLIFGSQNSFGSFQKCFN